MRHPLHVALPVSVPGPARAARHRRPSPWQVRPAALALSRVPPARRLAAGLGLAGVLAASALTAFVEPAAPVAPDRVPAGQSSTFAQDPRH
ncbi:hypothetical protein ACFWUZ_15780 [Streptomyces sp. NPDC058646]|uniref:hypothetical protein n=1 Tax=Streptomyces sp. NPDC058646 TaxID=3346574 RepID=UPI003650E581